MTVPPSPLLAEQLRDAALENPYFLWLTVSGAGEVVAAAPAVAALVGRETVAGLSTSELFAEGDCEMIDSAIKAPTGPVDGPRMMNLVGVDGIRHTILARVYRGEELLITGHVSQAEELAAQQELLGLTNELSVLARRHTQQARDLRRALEERDRSYWHLAKIQESLPICMDCGTVKPGGRWQSVADYLMENEIQLSHGLCPDCSGKRMDGLEA